MKPAVLLLTALCLAGAAAAQDFSAAIARADGAVGRVIGDVALGSGFVVAGPGQGDELRLVTNAHVLEGGGAIIVVFGLGAATAIFDARVIDMSRRYDLALLGLRQQRGPSHRPEPLPLIRRPIRKAEPVASIGFPTVSDNLIDGTRNPAFFESTVSGGAVSKVFYGSWAAGDAQFQLVQHTAPISSGNSGGPLIDLCGGLVGVNTGIPLAGEAGTPQGTSWASSSETLARYLDGLSVPYRASTAACLAAATAAQPAPPAAEPASDGLPTWSIVAFTVIGTGLAAVLGAIVLRSHRAPAPEPDEEQETAAQDPETRPAVPPAPAPGGIELRVAGPDGTASRHALDGQRLRAGVTIGRNPLVDVTLDDGRLSREHARLRLLDRRLTITDLGSTNGTHVDGRRLHRNETVQINSASRIEIGGLRLSVKRLGAQATGEEPRP